MRYLQNRDIDYHDNDNNDKSAEDTDDSDNNGQVPKHTSLEATPAYQGLSHWEICNLSPEILHISGLINYYDIMIYDVTRCLWYDDDDLTAFLKDLSPFFKDIAHSRSAVFR